MASQVRVPDSSKPDWEDLRGPAVSAVGDTKPGPQPKKLDVMSSPVPGADFPSRNNGLSKFEDAGFAATQARIARQHENKRGAVAGTGQANTAPMKENRQLKDVSAAGHAGRGNSPKRGKPKTTAESADIAKPVPLT
jgi:hypothetical protein